MSCEEGIAANRPQDRGRAVVLLWQLNLAIAPTSCSDCATSCRKPPAMMPFVPRRVARACFPMASGTILQASFFIAIQFVLIRCDGCLQFQ